MNSRQSGILTVGLAAVIAIMFLSAQATGQQGPGRGPISTPADMELEKQSYRNLEVAKFYFYKRKPDKKDAEGLQRLNKAVESRLLEIIDTNPRFARMDEVFFMLGEVYHRGGDAAAAKENWARVVKDYPDSEFKEKAQKRLAAEPAAKP